MKMRSASIAGVAIIAVAALVIVGCPDESGGARPSDPTNFAATAISPSEISLTWVDTSDNETGFVVQCNGGESGATFSEVAGLGPDTQSWTATGLSPNKTYDYQLCAVNAFGESQTLHAQATTLPAPVAAPSNLVATTVSESAISLTWKDNSDNETGFRLERSPDGSTGWTEIGTTDANVTSRQTSAPAAATRYYYRVHALGDNAVSDYSNVASAMTYPVGGPDTTAPTVTISNARPGGTLESGFIIGTASDNQGIAKVEVAVDGGPYVDATGTTTWSRQLPTGASIWKLDTLHTIAVRAVDIWGNVSAVTSFSVRKGTNRDLNGDGYVDLAIGAYNYSSGTGRVYIYKGTPGFAYDPATWTPTGSAGDRFGSAVALGDVNGDGYSDLIVGAFGYGTNTGRVYVFPGGSGGPASTPSPTLTGPSTESLFGMTVAAGDINGDGYADVAVGAPGRNTDDGYAAVYHGGAAGLDTSPTFAYSSVGDAYYGRTLAIGDANNDGYDDLVVGAPHYDSLRGAAYIHHGASTGLNESTARELFGGTGTNDNFGSALSMGDANGDGYADLAVGADRYSLSTGRAYVYHGSGTGIAMAPTQTLTGAGTSNFFGCSVALGDANGDGWADLAVGAEGVSSFTGQVRVYAGAASGIDSTSYRTLNGEAASHVFGEMLLFAHGNGETDGYSDLLVATMYHDTGSWTNSGKVYLYLGSSTGTAASATRSWVGHADGEQFGIAADF